MMRLNSIGLQLAEIEGVNALTDVTGFGLLGHLLEMCEGSNVNAVLEYNKIPIFPEALYYIEQNCIPGGTKRNWKSYGDKVNLQDLTKHLILSDAQTSGGLLISVDEDAAFEVEKLLNDTGFYAQPIGFITPVDSEKRIRVI
jgi:selenide,water dikinase